MIQGFLVASRPGQFSSNGPENRERERERTHKESSVVSNFLLVTIDDVEFANELDKKDDTR